MRPEAHLRVAACTLCNRTGDIIDEHMTLNPDLTVTDLLSENPWCMEDWTTPTRTNHENSFVASVSPELQFDGGAAWPADGGGTPCRPPQAPGAGGFPCARTP